MNPSSSQCEEYDKETRDLQGLLNAFASVCSLEDIASAYCSAKGNVDTAGEMLVELLDTKCGNNGNPTLDGETPHSSAMESKDDKVSVQKLQVLKYKKFTVSTGTVSNAIGRGYALPHQNRFRSLKEDGQLKAQLKQLNASDLSKSDYPSERNPLSSKDIEDFLFSMLHDGFNLDKEKIRDVLRSCGYDAKKSMEELLQLSPLKSTKGKEIDSSETSASDSSGESVPMPEFCANLTGSGRVVNESCFEEHPVRPLAVLEALYGDAKVPQKEPKRARLELGRNRKRVPREKVVTAPSVTAEEKPTEFKASGDIKDDNDEYGVLREAAKSHWELMKTYYESAFDAFRRGDHEKASCLLEKGKHHNKLAREADEKSAKEIVATRNTATINIFSLDLHMHHTKEAVVMLKQHLCYLAGIPSFSHLKVIVNSGDQDVTKGRRKQAIIKFLEKRSIPWKTEEEDKPETILIQMDLIDPGKLTFT